MALVHMHRHSEFSPLDGMGNAEQYAEAAALMGQTALNLTDHATLGGALDHIRACHNRDDKGKPIRKGDPITPIVGVEGYFRHNRRHAKEDGVEPGRAMHLCLHAASMRGWKTLMRLTSAAYTTGDRDGRGFYGKPVMDWDLIENDNEGLFCSTACIYGPINAPLIEGRYEEADENLERLLSVFGDRLYLEIMPHDFDPQRVANVWTINKAAERGLPLWATGDAHMPYQSWAPTHLILQMHATRQTFAERKKKAERGEDVYGSELNTLYLMSEQQMFDAFQEYHPYIPANLVQEAMNNTADAVKKMRLWVVDKDPKLPEVKGDPLEILDKWCREGMERIGKVGDEEYEKRLAYERGVLIKNGVVPYFCIVGDLVRWARSTEPLPATDYDPHPDPKKPIRNDARGSAAGCLISYLLGITAIDPIAYGLLFERFLNPDRKGLPDIDLDFSSKGREMVKEYLRRKYGRDHVADIIAHQYFAPRALVQDIGRIYGIPFTRVEEVKATIGPLERGLAKLVQKNPVLAKFAEDFPEPWEHMLILDDGLHRPSKHAAGVVIAKNPVSQDMPLELNKPKGGKGEASIVTAWSDRADFPIVSDYGFLKLDVLGVADLDRQDLAMEHIRVTDLLRPDPLELDVLADPDAADPEVLEAFAQGLTIGVFQFAGGGMTKLLRAIRPDCIGDLIAANALYRPGAMDVAHDYAKRKHGEIPESEWYWHPAVEPFLKETYGIVAYQEQVMAICKALGNFTGGQADSMRKAISKLYRLPGDQAREFMQGFRDQWMKGCDENGIVESIAADIWEKILEFAGYGFNKSHSATYAVRAYQDMDLKIKNGKEFYAAILTIPSKEKGFAERVIREARAMGVPILPPHANRSEMGFSVDGEAIRYGLLGVKGCGDAAAQEVVANRPFASYEDFENRVNKQRCNKAKKEALVEAGAFDWAGMRDAWSANAIKEAEAERLGLPISVEPSVTKHKELLDQYVYAEAEFEEMDEGDTLTVAGEVLRIKDLTTKKGQPMAFFDIGYGSDEFSCTLFTGEFLKFQNVLADADGVIVQGRKNTFNGKSSIIVSRLQNIDDFVAQQKEEEAAENADR